MPGRETRRKKSRAESKWRFNYNGRLITAIAHHEPSFSRNSRIIRAPGSGCGESPISLRTPLTPSKTPRRFPESLVLQPPRFRPSAYTHARTHTMSALSRSLIADSILSKSRALNTHSPPLITSNVSSLRDCLRTSLTTSKGMKTQWRLQAVIRETAAPGCVAG